MAKRRTQRGSVLTEFAVCIIAVMFLVFWMFELSMLVYTYTVLADAAKEGVRYAVVHGPGSSSSSGPSSGTSSDCTTNITAVQSVVKAYAAGSGHDTSAMTVNVCYLDGNNQPLNRVQVTISYNFVPFASIGWNPPTLKVASEGRIIN